jgi:transcriptional regulator with XRE-family HTH domain
MNASPAAHDAEALRSLLRHWREVRRSSQLDLALRAGISQRHLSFIESGRSVPGRETLMMLASALDIPLRDRNSLLMAAGYAPAFSESGWDSQEMQAITNALTRLLRQHEPFPAIVMDRYWNVLMTNESTPRFFSHFVDLGSLGRPRNVLRLMFDPRAMRPFICNWDAIAPSLLERVYRESVGRIVDEKTRELLAELRAYPGVGAPRKEAPDPREAWPVIPLSIRLETGVLNYFSMVTTVGTPQAIAAQELRIECMFPADEQTETRHRALLNAAAVASPQACA